MSVIEDGNRQVTDKALMEVFRRMEPLIRALLKGVGGGATDAVKFNNPNTALALRFLHFILNQSDADGYGLRITEVAGGLGIFVQTDSKIRFLADVAEIILSDAFGGITMNTATHGFRITDGNNWRFVTPTGKAFDVDNHSGVTLLGVDEATGVTTGKFNGGGTAAEGFADGVNPTDLATVEQITAALAGAILFDIANSGSSLDVSTTGDIGLSSGTTVTITGTDCQVTVDGNGFAAIVPTGKTYAVLNHLAAAVLSVDEATGVTTGTFAGGTP